MQHFGSRKSGVINVTGRSRKASQTIHYGERTKDRKAIVIQIGVLGDSLRNEQSEPITSKKVSDSICY